MSYPYASGSPLPPDVNQKKLLAGILGIIFGGLGIHRFILDDVKGGVFRIAITVLTCGAGQIIGIIEGIIYLTKPDQEFYETYIVGRRAWF